MNSTTALAKTPPAKLAVKLPMVGIETCKSALGISEDAVLALIDDGKIRWAWNLACQSQHTRFVRVLTRSLLAYQQPGLDQPKTIEAVADLFLPLTSRIPSGRKPFPARTRKCAGSSAAIPGHR